MKKKLTIWQTIFPWVATAFVIALSVAISKADTPPLGTNEFMKVAWVDENGQINVPEVVGTVARQTTNETNLAIANEAANTARTAASTATNAIKNAVSQLVVNDVHIYRQGNLVSFEALISWDPAHDVLACCEFETSEGNTHQHIGYVASQDIGTTKPHVKFHDTLEDRIATKDWEALPDAKVSSVTIHNETKDYGGVEYSKWYSVEVTDEPDTEHFYCLDIDVDSPDGDGMTLNVSGGFKDCTTATFVDGSLRKVYVGGLLKGVEYVD